MVCVRRAERERARVEQQSISNKLFTFEGSDDSGYPVYSPAPHVQQVCQVVDGFIYVANAEPGRGEGIFYLQLLLLGYYCVTSCMLCCCLIEHNHRTALHKIPHLKQKRVSLRRLRSALYWAPSGALHPGLCWCCRVSPGKKLKLSAPPAYMQVPAETGPGVELPALTWQRDSVCPIWLIPGW